MPYTIGLITEDFDTLDTTFDTSLLMAVEARRRGHRVLFCAERTLRLTPAGLVADFFESGYEGEGRPEDHFAPAGTMNFRDLDLALLRTDPPVDSRYLAVTFMLDHAGTLVLNAPAAIRRYNEKIAIFFHPDRILPTFVVLDETAALRTLREHPEITRWIAKPTNAFAGIGVAALDPRAPEAAAAALERTSSGWTEPVMLQQFNERVAEGDKRIFLLDGEPLGWVNRVPKAGHFLANIHAGAVTLPFALSESDRAIVGEVGRAYPADELPLLCIDVIGEKLSEVNVTCPSGLVQINRAMGLKLESRIIDSFERRIAARRR